MSYVGKLQIGTDGSQVLIGSTMYGICKTAASTAAKKIDTSADGDNSGKFINNNFDNLLQGVTIHVKFTLGNTATSNVTLLVGVGDNARALPVVGNCVCPAGTIISFTLDEGQNWVVNDNVDNDTTYTFAEGSENGKFSVTPSGGSAQAVKIHGLASSAYKGVITDIANNSTSADLPTTEAVVTYVASMTGGIGGLSGAMHFRGIATSQPSGTTVPTGISAYSSANPEPGDVVIYGDKEYVWIDSTSGWEELGDQSFNGVVHNTLLTTTGDMIYASAANTPARLAIGTGNNKFLKVNNGVPTWGVVEKSDVGLGNVTNDAQIPKSIGTTKGDIIYWNTASDPKRLGIGSQGQVLTVSSTGIPSWEANAATDEKVKQSPYNNGTDDRTFNILFKHDYDDNEETNGVYYSTVANKKLTFNPSTGMLSAASFSGALSQTAVLTALNYDSTVTTATFLRKDGSWKTLGVAVTANNSGSVLTDITVGTGTLPSLTGGVLANASVSNGVLILVNAVAQTFSAGAFPTITKSKANLSISQN